MNHTLRIKEIRIKELVAADNNTSFSIDYTLVVEIISSDTKKVITNELPAQVTIVKEGDTWKIDRYWESIKAGDLDMKRPCYPCSSRFWPSAYQSSTTCLS